MSEASTIRYDWTACAIAIAAGLGVAAPIGLLVNRFYDSPLFMTAVITTVGTVVGRWVYARVAKRGARPLSPEN